MKKYTFSLPNLLTYGRIIAVPLVVFCFFMEGHLEGADSARHSFHLFRQVGIEGHLKPTDVARWSAFVIFLIASITDFFDGYLARAWHQTSDFGRMLDQIADKLLVSACLLLLAADGTIAGWTLWAAIIILCREILVSGLREYLAELKISVPVSRLAKWKTTLQLTALSFLLIGPAGEKFFLHITLTGLVLLWAAAILTLVTGWDYFRAGIKHVIN